MAVPRTASLKRGVPNSHADIKTGARDKVVKFGRHG